MKCDPEKKNLRAIIHYKQSNTQPALLRNIYGQTLHSGLFSLFFFLGT